MPINAEYQKKVRGELGAFVAALHMLRIKILLSDYEAYLCLLDYVSEDTTWKEIAARRNKSFQHVREIVYRFVNKHRAVPMRHGMGMCPDDSTLWQNRSPFST